MNQPSNLEEKINQFLSKTEIIFHGTNMLARMQSLVDALGNPEKQLKIIHIAGTSGKTSTCYFAASLLQAAGYTTGLTVSPHVDSVRERAIVNLAPLSEEDWAAHITEFFEIVQKSGIHPSYFEFYMAFAFWLFAKLKLDYVVLETGLGGTWDGSNVATSAGKITVITDIGLDHTEILGEDLATIATEKAGIIHPDNHIYMYAQSPEITTVISTRAATVGAHLHLVSSVTKNFMVRNFNLAKNAVDFTIARDGRAALRPAQVQQAQKIPIPARAEEITYQNHQIIMDGSHNPQKLTAFVKYLDQTYPATNRTLVATLGSNKLATSAESMKLLRQISDSIILTSFENTSLETNKRTSIDRKVLAAAAKAAGFTEVIYKKDPKAALALALERPAHQIVITGSFYLLDHLRPQLLKQSAHA